MVLYCSDDFSVIPDSSGGIAPISLFIHPFLPAEIFPHPFLVMLYMLKHPVRYRSKCLWRHPRIDYQYALYRSRRHQAFFIDANFRYILIKRQLPCCRV